VEDSSICLSKWKNDSTLTIESSWSFESTSDLCLFDLFFTVTEGSGSLNPFSHYQADAWKFGECCTSIIRDSSKSLSKVVYENEHEAWIGSLRGLHTVISTGDEAVHRMKIIDSIYT